MDLIFGRPGARPESRSVGFRAGATTRSAPHGSGWVPRGSRIDPDRVLLTAVVGSGSALLVLAADTVTDRAFKPAGLFERKS
jgi:hypothetical protein